MDNMDDMTTGQCVGVFKLIVKVFQPINLTVGTTLSKSSLNSPYTTCSELTNRMTKLVPCC